VTRPQVKHVLPSRLPASAEADYSGLTVVPGPWDDSYWVVVPQAGDQRRFAVSPCQAKDCDEPPHFGRELSGTLCYAHYWQWLRDGRPCDVTAWALASARPPRERAAIRHLHPGGIDFTTLPPLVALEIRSVVAAKITRGDWTANRSLLRMLGYLTEAVRRTGAQSLLDRRPEDWILLAREISTVGEKTFTDSRSYLKTFFTTLHRALVADPWAEDLWLWRGGFDRLLSVDDGRGGPNIDWRKVKVPWLRDPAKKLAKQSLITGERAWGTIVGWARGLAPLSDYLLMEGADRPELLDRGLFLEYLGWVRETRGSKNSLQLVNTVAAILEALRAESLLPELPTPVYLRRGENTVEKIRQPRPYPADVLEQIDTKIIAGLGTDPTIRMMLRLNRWGGLRLSELTTLPLDCLRDNGKGGYWIEYWMTKTRSWRRFPVPADLASELRDQQARVRSLYGEAGYMFPSPARSNVRARTVHPWSASGFRRHVSALFTRHGITCSQLTGERITGGEIHRYRHTVGTTLLNNSWTQREVQDFLGHASPTMTAAYAEILDETLTRKAEQFHRDQARQQSAAREDPKVERLRSRFAAVLPNGFCTLPASKSCDFRPTPCLGCAFFDPGGSEFAEVHANHRKQLRLLIADTADTAVTALNEQILAAVDRAGPEDGEPA
jgi:integrase